jgi:HAE1 family hydrophobic/amphiphilic exporter-1
VNFSALFIRRSVMTTLVMAGILLAGVLGYRGLPVSDLPNIDFPTLLVSASLPGASPETMAAAVATPLERQFSTIAGLDVMTSQNSLGATQITLQFALSRDLDAAAQDVQAAITAASRQLPPEMPSPPVFQKVNPADLPILYIALTSPTLPLSEIDEYGQTMMAQRISMVSGVAQVQVYGAQKYAVRIQVSPVELASRGLGLEDVAAAVNAANSNQPTGVLEGPHRAYTVRTTGALERAAAYRPIVVAYRDGRPIRLHELGRVIDSVENDRTAAWYKDQRSVVLAVQRQPGTNTIEVSQAVQALLPSFRERLPASLSLHVLYDRAGPIEESVNDVKFTLLVTLILVVAVIFLFLRNARATLIPSLALPMSIAGTFAVIYLLGYNLDNLSLLALTLSVGFVVDDAIVMLENVVRHVEAGERPFEAAMSGAKEITFTILSMTLSLAAVFIPVMFLGGIVGRLFREFAVTIGVAILISGFISLTLTPMLAGRLLRPAAHGERHGRLYMLFERAFDASLRVYERGLRWSLDHGRLLLIGSALVLGLTVWLFRIIPKGFLPSEDNSQIFAATEAAEGVSFEEMARHQQAVARIIGQNPNVESYFSSAGARGQGGGTSNSGVLFARLKPRSERDLSPDEIIAQLRPELMRVPGIRTYLQNPPPIRLGGTLTKSQYQYTLQGTDVDELYRTAQALEAKLRTLPGLTDVASDLQLRNPQVRVVIHRDQAAIRGLDAGQIERALANAYAARQISTIYAANNTYQVILELLPEFRRSPAALEQLYLRSSTGTGTGTGAGAMVPLAAVAELRQEVGPLAVNHVGQLPAVTLSFNLRPGTSLGTAVAEVERVARDVVPATVSTSFQGTAQAFQSSLAGLGLLLLFTVAVIYMVLGILYESYIHPLTILSALPFAGVGALVTLLLFGQELDVYAFVGVIMLVGLVKKNGIMMIDFALEAEKGGSRSAREAIFEACLVRFRPIMMTTMAALVGTLPIALGIGAGAESRQPLGLAVVGGLLFSQLLTLFVTPVFFVALDGVRARLTAWRARRSKRQIAAVPAQEQVPAT